MIRKLKSIRANRADSEMNIQLGMKGIQAKVLGENLGVIKRDAFAGDFKEPAGQDKQLLKGNLDKLKQQGFGMKPGDRLKMKLLKKLSKQKGRGLTTHTSKGKTLPISSNFELKGQGSMSFMVKKVIPSILKAVGVPKNVVSEKLRKMVVQKALSMSTGKLPSVVVNLAKNILPLIAGAKIKHKKGKMGGGRLGKLLKKHKPMLLRELSKGIMQMIKIHINSKSKKKVFKGSGNSLPTMAGMGGFWKSFAKGFKSVFNKKSVGLLGTVATALGQPEIAIPLGIASELL